MSKLTYIDVDRNQALKECRDRKEELLLQAYYKSDDPDLDIDHIIYYDVSYAATIDVKDAWKVNSLLSLFYHDTAEQKDRDNIIAYLYNLLYQEYEEINRNQDYSFFPKPLQVRKAVDRVVNTGLQRTAQLITGKSNKYFTDYRWGEGTARVLPSDTKLQLQVARIDIGVHGFAEPRGSEIAFFGRFLENIPQANIWESGIFDGPSDTATMLLRTKYPGTTLTHFFQNDQVILMHLVYQLSV